MNSAAVNLKLPKSDQLTVIKDLVRFAPLEHGQNNMIYLIDIIPPSITEKIVVYQYTNLIEKAFKMGPRTVHAIAQNLNMEFFWPEQSIVNIN